MKNTIARISAAAVFALAILAFTGRERTAWADDLGENKICAWGPGPVCREETTQQCQQWATTTIGGGFSGLTTGGGVNANAGTTCAVWLTIKTTYYWTDAGAAASPAKKTPKQT